MNILTKTQARVLDYKKYYDKPNNEKHGEIWLKYDLNQVLKDVLDLYKALSIAYSEIDKAIKAIDGF